MISTAKEHKEEFQFRTLRVTHNKFEVFLKGEDFKLLLTSCLELDLQNMEVGVNGEILKL